MLKVLNLALAEDEDLAGDFAIASQPAVTRNLKAAVKLAPGRQASAINAHTMVRSVRSIPQGWEAQNQGWVRLGNSQIIICRAVKSPIPEPMKTSLRK